MDDFNLCFMPKLQAFTLHSGITYYVHWKKNEDEIIMIAPWLLDFQRLFQFISLKNRVVVLTNKVLSQMRFIIILFWSNWPKILLISHNLFANVAIVISYLN